MNWPDDRNGRVPDFVRLWKEGTADGWAADDYLAGYEAGLDALANVLFPLFASHDFGKFTAWREALHGDCGAWKRRMVAEGHLPPEAKGTAPSGLCQTAQEAAELDELGIDPKAYDLPRRWWPGLRRTWSKSGGTRMGCCGSWQADWRGDRLTAAQV